MRGVSLNHIPNLALIVFCKTYPGSPNFRAWWFNYIAQQKTSSQYFLSRAVTILYVLLWVFSEEPLLFLKNHFISYCYSKVALQTTLTLKRLAPTSIYFSRWGVSWALPPGFRLGSGWLRVSHSGAWLQRVVPSWEDFMWWAKGGTRSSTFEISHVPLPRGFHIAKLKVCHSYIHSVIFSKFKNRFELILKKENNGDRVWASQFFSNYFL